MLFAYTHVINYFVPFEMCYHLRIHNFVSACNYSIKSEGIRSYSGHKYKATHSTTLIEQSKDASELYYSVLVLQLLLASSYYSSPGRLFMHLKAKQNIL